MTAGQGSRLSHFYESSRLKGKWAKTSLCCKTWIEVHTVLVVFSKGGSKVSMCMRRNTIAANVNGVSITLAWRMQGGDWLSTPTKPKQKLNIYSETLRLHRVCWWSKKREPMMLQA
jgi:hypothetical protein